MAGDFDWMDSESIVVDPVAAIAVYTNPDDDIVVRVQGTGTDDDSCVVIPICYGLTVANAITKIARGDG